MLYDKGTAHTSIMDKWKRKFSHKCFFFNDTGQKGSRDIKHVPKTNSGMFIPNVDSKKKNCQVYFWNKIVTAIFSWTVQKIRIRGDWIPYVDALHYLHDCSSNPPPYIRKCVSVHMRRTKSQTAVCFTGHFKTCGPHYETCFMSSFCSLEFGNGS